MSDDFEKRLRREAHDGVRFSEARHERMMSGLQDEAVQAEDGTLRMRSPWPMRLLAAAAVIAFGALSVPLGVPTGPRTIGVVTPSSVPAVVVKQFPRMPTTLPITQVAVPLGVRHYAQFFLDQLDRACSIGRRAA